MLMKKKITFILLALLCFFASAATKLTLSNGIKLTFEGCTDNSVRIEAICKTGSAPAKELELKRKASKDQFVQAGDSYVWRDYSIEPSEKGYSILFKGKELYSSKFVEEKKVLRELRTWSEAKSFYGFGQAGRKTDLRNQSFTIFNVSKYGDHAYIFIPFYFTEKATSVYYNANGKDWIFFQDGEDCQAYTSLYKRIESYVCQEENTKDCVKKFYKETETSCMLPKWAYGYIQSKYGYKTQQEVVNLVNDFKKHDIPLDAVVLDLFWFRKMGDIYWTSPDFPNPQELDNFMEENGVKLITITEPFFSTASQNYKDLKSMNLLCKDKKGKIVLWRDWWLVDKDREGGLFNPLGKKASKFMGSRYSKMVESGIDGFWTDLGEPEGAKDTIFYGKYPEQVFHNYYNYYWSKALFEGMKAEHPDKRIFIMSRSATTGSGKFNVSVWSGDVAVSWPSLSNQVAYGVNTGLSGLPYWGSDVGGFTPEESPEELYVRWQQFGAFTPIYRAHGTGSREPYAYSKEAEEITRDAIKTRKALLPYIYSTARQTMNGIPMMRPMFFEDSEIPSEYNSTQYMFGDSILVSPICKPKILETEHTTYLPEGNWYNFYSLEKVSIQKGKNALVTKNSINQIPVFIKEGAIIPAQKDGENYIFVIPAENVQNTFTLYNDDGESEQYKEGSFAELQLSLFGNSLRGKVIGDKKFLSDSYTIVVPAKNGTFSKQKVLLDELCSGIQLK